MRIIGFLLDGVRHMGAVADDHVRDLGPAAMFWSAPAMAAATPGGAVLPLAGVVHAPPVPETSRIFCVGINYHSHASEAKAGLDAESIVRAALDLVD